jgi:hypothetical protein
MKKIMSILPALALCGTGLIASPEASAQVETRDVNGYTLQLVAWQNLVEDVQNVYLIFFSKGKNHKSIPVEELLDTSKNDIKIDWLYYGTKDTPDNYTAKPQSRKDFGNAIKAFFDDGSIADSVLQTQWMVPTRPGVYGLHFSGLMNGATLDETFVCGKASQDPKDGMQCAAERPMTWPGTVEDGYRPNSTVPVIFTPPGEHTVQRPAASGDTAADEANAPIREQMSAVAQQLNPLASRIKALRIGR